MSRKKRKSRLEKVEIEGCTYVPKPLVAKTTKQGRYISEIHKKSVVIATGYSGTSKTYIPSRLSAKMFKKGEVSKIILVRPATSKSKSVGYFAGSKDDKMKEWLRPVIEAMSDELPKSEIDYMVKTGTLDFVPMETIKGNSWRDAFIIVDEAEDCTFDELEHIMTRVGTNSTMVLAGDIHQTDLRKSGLEEVIELVRTVGDIYKYVGYIDFSDEDDIVRSEGCKVITLGFHSWKKHKED